MKSFRVSRILLPILIGLSVVAYLLWKQFDPVEFAKINWDSRTLFWILVALGFLVCRHLAYSMRLYVLSEGDFSFRKCIELIFIWEFSSAISPTNVGGSAVALFILSQEKLPPARTAAIVLHTIIADAAFFVLNLTLLFLILGPAMIRPGATSIADLDHWGNTLLTAFLFIFLYGVFFAYGLFIGPGNAKKILLFFTRLPFLKRFHDQAGQLGDEFVIASKHIARKSLGFHISGFVFTAIAWSSRFLTLIAVMLALVHTIPVDFWTQIKQYGRIQSMFSIMAVTPTPGGSGMAEYVFGGFLADDVPRGIAFIIAFIWRLLAYYSYLLIGVIIIPNWWMGIVKRRRHKRQIQESESST